MANDPIANAKAALGKASDFTKSVEGTTPSRFAVKAKPAAKPAVAPAKPAEPSISTELGEKTQNVMDYTNAPKMHKGGTVPGKPGEEVPIIAKAGEKVVPAEGGKSMGRNSEYRKVYIARQQKRDGGGNTPVKESAEKHDQKKAKSGQPSQKEADKK